MMPLEQLAHTLGCAKREGDRWRCLCPAHNDHRPSLSICIADNGKLLVKCWAGCDSRDVLRAIKRLTGNHDVRPSRYRQNMYSYSSRNGQESSVFITRTWNGSLEISHGDLVDNYLKQRGIHLGEFPSVLRFSRQTYCRTESGSIYLPAMIASLDFHVA